MKKFKKLSPGMILLNVFLISTIVLITILLFRLLPDSNRLVVTIWIVEFFLVIAYCLFFYDARKARKNGKKNVSVLRH